MILDPKKQYAELAPWTNIVARVFFGETVEDWAMPSWRKIIEIPVGVTVGVGDRYQAGAFSSRNTPQRLQETLEDVVQRHLDARAREFGYDSIFTAVTYAEEPAVAKFQSEGQAFRAWRSKVWARCYELLAEVQAGARGIPTESELLAELPALEGV